MKPAVCVYIYWLPHYPQHSRYTIHIGYYTGSPSVLRSLYFPRRARATITYPPRPREPLEHAPSPVPRRQNSTKSCLVSLPKLRPNALAVNVSGSRWIREGALWQSSLEAEALPALWCECYVTVKTHKRDKTQFHGWWVKPCASYTTMLVH